MSFREEILDMARRGELFLDCHEMELKQNCEERPGIVRGPGYIKQNERGGLEFKIYAKEHENVDLYSRRSAESEPKPGELYQHSHYYTLTAIDFWGNRWTAGRILPKIHSSYHLAPPSTFVTGTFFEIEARHEEDRALVDHYLDLAIYTKVEVPFNTCTIHYESVSLDKTVFRAAGCDFTVRQEQDVLLISVQSSDPIPADFETRIIEGLLFVLGQPLAWSESMRKYHCIEHARLRSRISERARVQMKAPIDVRQDAHKIWVLFDLYLRFIGGTEGPGFHPCSSYLFSVSQASANTVDSFALALAVAVEGLVNTLYKHLGERTARFGEAVSALKDYVLSWPDLDYWGKEADIDRKRLPGLIGNLKHVSPQNRMYLLVESGYLVRSHVDIWKKVRHREAHALDDPTSSRVQEQVRQNDTLIVLVYHLVFHKIGYEGIYSDYSTVGYPPRLYPPRLSQPVDPG